MRLFYLLLWIVVIIFGVTFGLLNARYVRLDYYFHTSEMLLPILLAITLIIGIVLGWLSMSPVLWRARFSNLVLRRKIKQHEKNNSNNEEAR